MILLKLKVKFLGFEAGGKLVVLNREDAEELGVSNLGRVRINSQGKELTAIVNIATRITTTGYISVSEEVISALVLKEDIIIDVELAPFPTSLYFLRNKLRGRKLDYGEMVEIVRDIVEGNLSDTEIASFVTTLHNTGLDLDEATSLSLAMIETGQTLKLNRSLIVDKHSIGGVPGDKTSLILVPIIAACGLTIPKSSSRAITSAAGTADRAEVLMPVTLESEEMKRVVEKTDGCIAWGGCLDLAPADDIFVKIENSLSIDPILLPSIMSKKKSVGTNLLVIDIPCGRGTKVKTIGEADLLAKDFMELGRRLDIKVKCAVTYGEQPVGYAIGPSLEAREALRVLTGDSSVPDLVDKVTDIAAILLEMSGKENGKNLAVEALSSGRALKKMREIIEAQGGNPKINPDDIVVGDQQFTVLSDREGFLQWIDNAALVEVARLAGAPKNKGAGILLHKKIGDNVNKNDPLLTIYAEKSVKLQRALSGFDQASVIGVGDRMEMLIHEVVERPVTKKAAMLER